MAASMFRTLLLTLPLSASVLLPALAQDQAPSGQSVPQRSFATAEQAAAAMKAALGKGDVDALLDMFGRDNSDILLGDDPGVARVERQRVAALTRQKLAVVPDGADRAVLDVGDQAWPLPIPLVRQDGQWRFDTAAGAQEILARRIGQDELGAIAALKAYVAAEKDYAMRRKQAGKPTEYARFVQSTPGQADGLWWNAATTHGAGASPLTNFVATQQDFLKGRQPDDPFRGYYFRVLTAQGPSAPHGAMSYLDDAGRMTKGFAILAWPADYKKSGVMSFMVGSDGRVLQRDLGEDTSLLVEGIRVYDPDARWTPAR